jgi:hypothetical protein
MHRFSLPWLGSVVRELPNRYGTEPYLPIIFGLIVILVCGVVYWLANPFVPAADPPRTRSKSPRFFFAMLYSVETFVPILKVTGIKDWGWVIKDSAWRWLEAFEGLAGGLLTILAAYSLSVYPF